METKALEKFAKEARKRLHKTVAAKIDYVLGTDSAELRAQSEAVGDLRKAIASSSRERVVERVAYTWFNRFCALRFMDVHQFTRVGVVSPLEGFSQPEMLQEAKQGHIDESFVGPEVAAEVRDILHGRTPSSDPQQAAYRLLLVGACNHFHGPMPFMFERIADYTELLLPDDLLSSESILEDVRAAMTPEACESAEVIGWLYQFYISDRKDQVIGKVVKSEDIPAATQLFTPNWIVKYMVQNSLGAQWLATYPDSPLREQMEYFIEPAEHTEVVNAQVAAITPSQLDPEELTLIDPACGSGHILVEAYELFKSIYLERGYRQRDVPQLILEKNLFGLDIDERAAQLTGFALMMQGRADDRRLFEREVTVNVMALVDSAGFEVESIAKGVELTRYGLKSEDLTMVKQFFEQATIFGSLVQVPRRLAEKLPALSDLSTAITQDLFVSSGLKRLRLLVQQAELLAKQYDAVVANPPYMGAGGMNTSLKRFVKKSYPESKSDLYSCFMDRGLLLAKPAGHCGMVTMQSWMFLSAFEKMRERILRSITIRTMAHLGPRAFGTISGEVVQTTAFVLQNLAPNRHRPVFFGLQQGDEARKRRALASNEHRFDKAEQAEFERIPSSPIAYWLPQTAIEAYRKGKSLGDLCYGQPGLQTSNNKRFIRFWSEVSRDNLGLGCPNSEEAKNTRRRWFPLLKGGEFRKWSGNQQHVVNWRNDGEEIKSFVNRQYPYLKGNIDYVVKDRGYFFRPLISFTRITGGMFSARSADAGFIFDVAGSAVFPEGGLRSTLLGFMCSKLAAMFVRAQNPTMTTQSGDVDRLPIRVREIQARQQMIGSIVEELRSTSSDDWDSYERSWEFQILPMLATLSHSAQTLESTYNVWITKNKRTIAEVHRLEEENNRLFIDAYGLSDELTPDVPIEQITLTVNPAYRYDGKLSQDEQWSRFRQDTMKELVSYAVGCMFGRYSLDEPGLILANQGDTVEDYLAKVPDPHFTPDEDNVIPILDADWFTDDIVERFRALLKAALGETHFEENMAFLEEGLGRDIRSYFQRDFYKDHVKTYKKRPIYWLFSSPKGTFNALVYLHRYRPDTVSIVLNDYLREFTTKLRARREYLVGVSNNPGASQRDRTKALKDIDKLDAQILELEEYESDVLYPLAAKQLEIDLDDGVKANYPKFGKALKKVAGLS